MTVKIVVFAAVVVIEILVAALVGIRMVSRGRAAVAVALAVSALVTVVVLGYVLFVLLD